MNHQQKRNLQSSQQSIFYNTEMQDDKDSRLRKCPQYYKQHYPGMLIEDVANHIMPYRGTSRKNFSVNLVPSDGKKTEELVASAIDREGYSYDLMSATHTFFTRLRLFHYGI